MCLPLACLSVLLGGCSSKTYHIESHEDFADTAPPVHEVGPRQFPTVTMKPGESFLAVEPAQGIGPGGYWEAIWVEDQGVVRAEPLGSYTEGTILTAMAPGKTKAYYGNAATLPRRDVQPSELKEISGRDWFWIEVVEPEAASTAE